MRDYCDGSHYLNHPIFSKDNNALQIQLYYDEMDVCNPIGSKSGVHKLGEFLNSHNRIVHKTLKELFAK